MFDNNKTYKIKGTSITMEYDYIERIKNIYYSVNGFITGRDFSKKRTINGRRVSEGVYNIAEKMKPVPKEELEKLAFPDEFAKRVHAIIND